SVWATGLPCGRYWFQVALHDVKNGVYRYGAPYYYDTKCATPPLGAVVNEGSKGDVELQWTADPSSSGIVITRKSTLPPSSQTFVVDANGSTSMLDSPPWANVTYSYYISSLSYDSDVLGQENYSDPVQFSSPVTPYFNSSGCETGSDS